MTLLRRRSVGTEEALDATIGSSATHDGRNRCEVNFLLRIPVKSPGFRECPRCHRRMNRNFITSLAFVCMVSIRQIQDLLLFYS